MKDQWLKGPDGKICYQQKGKGKEVLVCIHGGTGSLSAYCDLLPYFDTLKYKVLLVDLRGHGKSFRPADWRLYDISRHTADVFCLLEHLNIDNVSLIGHCLGSMVAASFAKEYPEKTRRLILVNPGKGKEYTIFFRPLRYVMLGLYIVLRRWYPRGTGTKNRLDYRLYRKTGDFSISRILADCRSTGIYTIVSQALCLFSWESENVYSSLSVKTLVIGGARDLIFRPKLVSSIASSIQEATLIFVDTNHPSLINNPKQLADAILRFLSS